MAPGGLPSGGACECPSTPSRALGFRDATPRAGTAGEEHTVALAERMPTFALGPREAAENREGACEAPPRHAGRRGPCRRHEAWRRSQWAPRIPMPALIHDPTVVDTLDFAPGRLCRTIVRQAVVVREHSSDSTFNLKANPFFFNRNSVCLDRGAKLLFDIRKWVDRRGGGTYSGAKWQKVGESGSDFAGNRCSRRLEAVAGE